MKASMVSPFWARGTSWCSERIVWLNIIPWNHWVLSKIADALHWGICMQISLSFSPVTMYLLCYVALVLPKKKKKKLMSLVIRVWSWWIFKLQIWPQEFVKLIFINLWRNLGQIQTEIRATPSTQHIPWYIPCTLFTYFKCWAFETWIQF